MAEIRAESAPATSDVRTYNDGLVFLDDFTDDQIDETRVRLRGHLVGSLADGSTAVVSEYSESLRLSDEELLVYGEIMRELIELQVMLEEETDNHADFQSSVNASLNWLKYRYALGIMQPAISEALSDQSSAITLQARTIAAVSMADRFVANWFNFETIQSQAELSSPTYNFASGMQRQFNRLYQENDRAYANLATSVTRMELLPPVEITDEVDTETLRYASFLADVDYTDGSLDTMDESDDAADEVAEDESDDAAAEVAENSDKADTTADTAAEPNSGYMAKGDIVAEDPGAVDLRDLPYHMRPPVRPATLRLNDDPPTRRTLLPPPDTPPPQMLDRGPINVRDNPPLSYPDQANIDIVRRKLRKMQNRET